MKRAITFMFVMAAVIFMGSLAKAQDLSSLGGSNYYLIYLDADTEANAGITGKIIQDLRLNWDFATNPAGEKALYIWSNTYVANSATGKGSLGQIGGFLDFSVATGSGWSGLGFCMRFNGDNATFGDTGTSNVGDAPGSFPVDFTKVTDNYRFHMAVKTTTGKPTEIQVFGSSTGVAKFSVGVGSFESTPNITPNFKSDGTWNIIDIPVSQLRTLGFTNRSTFKGNYFVVLSGAATNNIAIDAVYFYSTSSTGINDVKADQLNVLVTNRIVEVLNTTAPVNVFSITGALVKTSVKPIFGVEELAKGAYIIKSGNAVAKIMIK